MVPVGDLSPFFAALTPPSDGFASARRVRISAATWDDDVMVSSSALVLDLGFHGLYLVEDTIDHDAPRWLVQPTDVAGLAAWITRELATRSRGDADEAGR